MDRQDVSAFYRWRKKGYLYKNKGWTNRKNECFWWYSRAIRHGLIFTLDDLQRMKHNGWTSLDFKKEALKWGIGKSPASKIKFLQLLLWMGDWTYISPYKNYDPTMKDYLRTLQKEYYGE